MKGYFVTGLIMLAVIVGRSEAGFRCTFGDGACSFGCKVLGQSGGTCDDNGKCWCSEEDLSLDAIREALPSRCDISESLCESTCHAIGRASGTCSDTGCECSDTRLTPEEFFLCAAASTCRIHCQAKGSASGSCLGWTCNCESNGSSGGGGDSEVVEFPIEGLRR